MLTYTSQTDNLFTAMSCLTRRTLKMDEAAHTYCKTPNCTTQRMSIGGLVGEVSGSRGPKW